MGLLVTERADRGNRDCTSEFIRSEVSGKLQRLYSCVLDGVVHTLKDRGISWGIRNRWVGI